MDHGDDDKDVIGEMRKRIKKILKTKSKQKSNHLTKLKKNG